MKTITVSLVIGLFLLHNAEMDFKGNAYSGRLWKLDFVDSRSTRKKKKNFLSSLCDNCKYAQSRPLIAISPPLAS